MNKIETELVNRENALGEAQNDLAHRPREISAEETRCALASGSVQRPCSAISGASEKHKIEMEEAHQKMIEWMRLRGFWKRIKMSLLCLFGKRTVAYCLCRDTVDVMESLKRACQGSRSKL